MTAIDRHSDAKAGQIRNIHFENIDCVGENGVFLHGSEGHLLKDISFRRIRVRLVKKTTWPANQWDLRPCEGEGLIPGKVHGFTCVYGDGIRCEDVQVECDDSMKTWYEDEFLFRDTENVTRN